MVNTTRALALMAIAGLLALPVRAQLFRAYLASEGSDSNPCTLLAPCRLLPAALAAVNAGGEIWILDSANFNTGMVTISKSVSIRAIAGAFGSLVSTGGSGASAIQITGDGLDVVLRNIFIGPLAGSPGYFGVYLDGMSSVLLDACVVANVSEGIFVTHRGTLTVVDSVIRNNSAVGINLQWDSVASVYRSSLIDNYDNVVMYGNTGQSYPLRMGISDSVLSGGRHGAWVRAVAYRSITYLSVLRSKIERMTYGLHAESDGRGGASISVSGSLLTGNSTALFQDGFGSISSRGNNHVFGNGADAVGTIDTLPPQ